MPKRRPQTTSFDLVFESSFIQHRETIRKSYSTSDDQEKIPLAIQIFLWRQSNPFIKQKFGNLTNASAIIFDQVLVQNILHGLSPSLTDAITNSPRWLLIKAAFPHVMHACSAIIERNLYSIHQSLPPPPPHPSLMITASPSRSPSALTQLQVPSYHQLPISLNLITISNQILPRSSSSTHDRSFNHIEICLFRTLHHLLLYPTEDTEQFLSLNTIQLFIYLFCPYIQTYIRQNEKEFLSHADLVQGMRLIWQPLFEYHQPNIRIFNAFVKPNLSANDQSYRLSTLSKSSVQKMTTGNLPRSDKTELKLNPLILRSSDPITKYDSTSDLEAYGIGNMSKIHAPIVHMNSICSETDLTQPVISSQNPVSDKVNITFGKSFSISSCSTPCSSQPPMVHSLSKTHPAEHLLLATYFDIGIIRTLFSPSWLTEGYLWCLEYLSKRLNNISDEILSDANLSSQHLKSLSMFQLNSEHPKRTNQIIENQYQMTTALHSIEQGSILFNTSFSSSSKKIISQTNSNYFLRQKRDQTKIHYIDEDRIEHLDLANDHLSLSSSKTSHLYCHDSSLPLFQPLISDQSNLNTMKMHSRSDSEINYKHLEETPEGPGSTGYINRNGTLNFSVILAGIHAVICKESHLKICELAMNILDILLGLNVLSSMDNQTIDEIDQLENEKFQLSIDIILRILKRLGCKNCQPRNQNFAADQLRGKVRLSLNKLRLIHRKRFEKSFLNFTANGELTQILEILHALCEYCSKSNLGLVHYAPYVVNQNENCLRQNYANNFDDELKTIDGLILNLIFKPLITRLHLLDESSLMAENVTLQSECRAFLIYMKENHGGIFRLAIFSALIDPEKQLKIFRENYERIRVNLEERSSMIDRPNPAIDDHSLDANQDVDLALVRMGLLRLNFLMESCPPGLLPDPEFLNSVLFLNAPMISKAAFLIECAYFIRRCAGGQWPEWMRMNITLFRPHDAFSGRMNGNSNVKINKIYQAAAARMFYLWGEALSSQLESILDIEEYQSNFINDQTFEDYYNEAIVNPSGHDCPYSLQLVVCLLLYEITTFLREIYPTLPKLSSLSTTGNPNRQPRMNNSQPIVETNTEKRSADYLRADSLISQVSNRSTLSTTSEQPAFSPHALSAAMINMNPLINERHISFVVNKENDSNESRHTTIVMNDDDGGDKNITTVPVPAPSKSKLIRRNSAKLRKSSVKTKDRNANRSSFRTRRRSHASNFSSDTDGYPHNIGTSTIDSTDESRNIHVYRDEFDAINIRPYPWIRIIIRIFNNMNLTSDKQIRSCQNLFKALVNMYQTSSSTQTRIIPDRQQRFSMYLFSEETVELPKEEEEVNKHFQLISIYLEKQVGSLIQIPLMILCKSAVLLEEEHYSQILRLSWELLLDRNEELASCAATFVILTGARAGHLVDRLIHTEMESSSVLNRYNAILRFSILWRFRHQFWIRLEENAHAMMKILPPSIEFVLPSPALGMANLQIVDPPWMPHAKTLVQQVAFNQEEVRTVVTTSKTRKKHQQELIHNALMTEETSRQVARENFAMSTVAMLQTASFEPLLHQSRDEEDEAHIDDERAMETSVQLRQAQGTFPSAFGAAIFQLVEMLEDEEIIDNGAIVSGAARQALWTCLIDEPTLFIRFFFEKISHKERRIKSLQTLRRLMIYLVDIPSQFAHAIFNYVLGLLLSTIRSPLDNSQELIIAGLALLWQVIPYLHGLVLKDFKQILRKEQAEMMLLITGNIPSTKKIIIHGPDLSQIPTQAIISEDTQFYYVLQEALEFFGISDSKRDGYHLIDTKTQQIHIPDTYVRDFYFFRRNIYPQLALIYLDTKQSQRQLEQIAICVKTMELSKVLFARYLIESTPFNQIHNCVTFFHDELLKSPLFPRKPLESDFNLYTKLSDKELWNLDMLHKYNWIKLITCIFFNMDGKTSTTWDITLFLPVINGSFILHCEDLMMLRYSLASYINIVKHFRHIFATNGYLLIMPTLLRVYSNIQSNPMLRQAIEYCCRQFFILHRIPFLLQMLGSISQLLDSDEQADVTDTNKIQPNALFRLLIALEQTDIDAMRDEYSILELVKNDSITTKIINTPVVAALGQGVMMSASMMKSLDFCYADDQTIFTLLNCFDVCVTVVAYEPDSIRSLQMLSIIDILLPKYLDYRKDLTNKNDILKHGRDEIKIMERLSIAMKTMINACESFTRIFVEPKCEVSAGGNYKYSRSSYRSPSIVPDEDSMNRFIEDRTKSRAQDADERKQASEFRWPRDTLLSIVSTYIHFSTQRSKELIKLLNDPTLRSPELLDAKSHTRLADIAHTLLKLSSFDTLTISSRGLQSYFQKLLPYTNWSEEQLHPALNLLLRRIDRMFLKICKKPMTKRCFDWEATAGILNGIYCTIDRHPYIAYFPNLKTLVSGCIALILNENVVDSNHSVPRLDTPTFPKEFSRAVIKLAGKYLLAIKCQPNLEILTSNNWSSTSLNSTINHFLHFLLPLMFWAGSGRKDAPKLHPIDISYIVTILLNSIKPPAKLATTIGSQTPSVGPIAATGKQYLSVGEGLLSLNNIPHKSMRQVKDLLQIASLLGLKILVISFHKQIKREWQRIIQSIKSICNKQSNISSNLLSFIDFIVSYPTPIYLILRPFLLHYMHSVTSENEHEIIRNIQRKLVFERISPAKPMSEILHELLQELNQLKAEFIDEPKSSNSCDSDKVRFDTEPTNARDDATDHPQSHTNRSPNFYRFRRQQQVDDSNSNTSVRKRTERIQVKEALDILEPYYARYKIRCAASARSTKKTSNYLSSMTDETSTTSPSRSITIGNERTPSLKADRSPQHQTLMLDNPLEQPSTDEKSEPKLRTFRGWKRNTAQLDRSRLSKTLWLSQISSEPIAVYDATEEMSNIFRSVRQVNDQNSDPTVGLQSEN